MASALTDSFRFIQALSFLKLRNFLRPKTHRYKPGSGRAFPPPWSVSVETAACCNLQCPACIHGTDGFSREKGLIRSEDFLKMLNKIPHEVFYLNLSFQGEPMMNRQLPEMIRAAKKRKMYVVFSTNGHFFDKEFSEEIVESGTDRVIISVDGLTEETYAAYRKGGSLARVMEGMACLKSARKKLKKNNPLIIAQFLTGRHNEHEASQAVKRLTGSGADKVVLKSMQIPDTMQADRWLPQNKKFRRYFFDENGRLMPDKKASNTCSRLKSTAVITWKGEVLPCCFDKNADYVMGNLLETDFTDIWNGKPFVDFRERVNLCHDLPAMCKNCTEGLKLPARLI